ncbi:Na+/H+ antiporter [Pedobacter sp. L105]|uniref:Na+/H+ antiporter n=1 Tax=Pedobacter sp. L105 TaxID=1641871 RepID=UPI00131A7FCB|nr:Na+/H+ antiporter [Pedobacter sp. L105]
MHHLIIQYTFLLAVIVFVVMLARKINISYPILLVVSGLFLGFVPALRGIEIEPEMIFVIFLPPLLYESAWSTSWKDFWKWRRMIISFASLIVIVTSCVIAEVSSHLIPEFTLASGFLLGAIISPPDAVSATSVLKNVKIPKRLVTILEGESLMNDAASLIVFSFAMKAVTSGKFVFTAAASSFVIVIVMGIATGVAVAIIFYAIHRYLPTTTNIDIILTFITPYAMYIIAEEFHFSGVLAVVSGGLFLSVRRHSFLSHQSRLQGINVWEAISFVLNGFVFMLIGLEFPVIIKNLGPSGLKTAVTYSAIIAGVLIITRLVSTFGAFWFTIFMRKFIKTADDSRDWKAPVILGWAGMRGVVSLAAALSIPVAFHSGEAFPNRNLILFITFSVILVTLILQGLTLPFLIKWLNMQDPDHTVSYEEQQNRVRKKLSMLSLNILNTKYQKELEENEMVMAIKTRLDADIELLNDWDKQDNRHQVDDYFDDYKIIMEELLDEQRKMLKNLNKKENINNELIRQQLTLLDLEEEKMRQHFINDVE